MKNSILKFAIITILMICSARVNSQTNVTITSSRPITSCGNSVQIYDATNVLLTTSICIYSGTTSNILCLTGIPSYIIVDECGTGCSFRVNLTGAPTTCGICTCNCSIGSPTVTATLTPPGGIASCFNPYLLSVLIN